MPGSSERRRASTIFGKIKFQILSVRLQRETRVLVLQSRLVSSARLFHLLIAGQKVGPINDVESRHDALTSREIDHSTIVESRFIYCARSSRLSSPSGAAR